MPGNSQYKARKRADLVAASLGGIALDTKRSVTESLRIVLRERAVGDYPKGTTKARALASKLVDEALKGNISAAKEVLDRLEGRAPFQESVGGPGVAVQIVINSEDAKVL